MGRGIKGYKYVDVLSDILSHSFRTYPFRTIRFTFFPTTTVIWSNKHENRTESIRPHNELLSPLTYIHRILMADIDDNIFTLMPYTVPYCTFEYLIFLLTSYINVEHHNSMDLNISYKGYNVTNIKKCHQQNQYDHITNIPVAVGYNDYY